MSGLLKYSTEDLESELRRRRLEAGNRRPVVFCDDCAHFMAWKNNARDVPKNYNPCAKGHWMSLRLPDSYSDAIQSNWGLYRRNCSDRQTIKPADPNPGA